MTCPQGVRNNAGYMMGKSDTTIETVIKEMKETNNGTILTWNITCHFVDSISAALVQPAQTNRQTTHHHKDGVCVCLSLDPFSFGRKERTK